MKKLILLTLLSLCVAFQASAWSPSIMTSGESAACAAPAWYNQTGITVTSGTGAVAFAWDADDGVTAYSSTCNAVTGTLTGGDIDTYQSDTALRVDAADEYIVFTQTANQYFKNNAAQTMCVRTYLLDEPDAAGGFLLGLRSGDNRDGAALAMAAATAGGYMYWNVIAGDETAVTTAINHSGWRVVGGTWVAPTNDGISVNEGDEATWLDGYDDDVGDTINAYGADADRIYIGNASTAATQNLGAPGAGNDYYISAVAIIDGYKADCSELTGW